MLVVFVSLASKVSILYDSNPFSRFDAERRIENDLTNEVMRLDQFSYRRWASCALRHLRWKTNRDRE